MQVLEFGSDTDQQYISIVKPKLITRNFLSKYIDKQPPFGQLGLIVYLRTYSRFIPQLKRREKWWETCLRVVEYSFSLLPDKPRKPSYFTQEKQKAEAEALFDTLFNLRGFTSGRTLFVGGSEASRLYPSSNFNCSYCNVDSLKSFTDAMYLLLLGCGVGYSVESKHVSKLPRFNREVLLQFEPYAGKPNVFRKVDTEVVGDSNSNYEITVGDSKEGWVTALQEFLWLHSSQDTKTITLNFDSVRPEGERLKTFGGRASGYIPLQTMFEEIHDRIISTDNGVIDSVTAMDIMNSIAKAIVVGGVRRSSQIAFGDVDDANFRDAKKDLWSNPEKAKYSTTRVLSNNSVHLWERPTFDRLVELFETIKNNGEPALSIAGNASLRRENYSGSNPCFVDSTLILTKNGYFPIVDLVGKTEEVWDGDEWVEVNSFRVTGENQPVFKITMQDGSSVLATEYHKFILEDGSIKQLKELQAGEKLQIHDVQVRGTVKTLGAYAKGFLVAEGTNIDKIKPKLNVYETKYSCIDRLISSISQVAPNSYGIYEKLDVAIVPDGKNRSVVQGLSARRSEFLDFSLKYKCEFPIEVLNWCDEDKFDFIAGYLDGDGTAMDTKNGFAYQVTSVSKEYLSGFQTLLKTIGVQSKISLTRKAGVQDFNDGYGEYAVKDAWRLTIPQSSSVILAKQVKFSRLTSFAERTTAYKVKTKRNIISSIEYSHVADKVYCLTNYKSHKVSLGIGLVTGQCHEILLDNLGVCNLTTQNLLSFVDEFGNFLFDAAIEAVKILTRVGSRITLVDMWDKDWDYIQKRDRLLGVSLTGIVEAYNALNNTEKLNWEYYITELRKAARNEADIYHDALGIPRSYLVTTLKPEGTLSQLPTVSSGVHAPYAPYYTRRIRISKRDPIANALLDLGLVPVPENGQGNDIHADECNTWVFSFSVKTKAQIRSIDESAIEQLERYKFFMKNWAEHTVSVTITVAENEWDGVVSWVWENWEYCIGIAFLPRFDPAELDSPYPNMPYESSTETDYQPIEISESQLVSLISKYETEYEEYDLDASCGGLTACPVR